MNQLPTLADLLSSAPPEHPAIILPEDGSVTTYRELGEQVESLALALLASGLEPGQTVAIVLPNGLENVAIFLAVTRARSSRPHLTPLTRPMSFASIFKIRQAGPSSLPRRAVARDAARELGLPVWTANRDRQGRSMIEGACDCPPHAGIAWGGRYRPVSAHQRHHEPAQGRALDARQPDGVDPQHRGALPAQPGGHRPGGDAVVSRPWADRGDPILAVGRRHPGHAAAFQRPDVSGPRSRPIA